MEHVPMDSSIEALRSGLQQTICRLKSEYAKLQTGRASASVVENIRVEAYGKSQPLKGIAGISVQDARTVVIQPWDKGVMQEIETALRDADLGVNPVNDGAVVRLNFPPMTEERRIRLVKMVHELAEEARISVRQQRKEVHTNARKDTGRSKDEHQRFENAVQKEVDAANKEIEEIAKAKEADTMKV